MGCSGGAEPHAAPAQGCPEGICPQFVKDRDPLAQLHDVRLRGLIPDTRSRNRCGCPQPHRQEDVPVEGSGAAIGASKHGTTAQYVISNSNLLTAARTRSDRPPSPPTAPA